jgi:hypothetical protein
MSEMSKQLHLAACALVQISATWGDLTLQILATRDRHGAGLPRLDEHVAGP